MESTSDLLSKLNKLFNEQRETLFQEKLPPTEERRYIARRERIDALLARIKHHEEAHHPNPTRHHR